MLGGDDLHMAIDVVNDQQLMPMLSNYHSTKHYMDNNVNSNNIDGVDDDNGDNDLHKHHRTRFVRRRKRFGNLYLIILHCLSSFI